MKLPAILAGASAIALTTILPAAAQDQAPAVTMQYAVKISLEHSMGSGVVVGHATLNGVDAASIILTCDHVLTEDGTHPPPPYVKVTHGNETIEGTVLGYEDKEKDLALVLAPVVWPVAPFYRGSVQSGEQELIVGYPLDTNLSITSGYISAPEAEPYGLREGSAPAWPGNSGGGVFVLRDGQWKLAGIADAIHTYPVGGVDHAGLANTVSFFVDTNTLDRYLTAHGVVLP